MHVPRPFFNFCVFYVFLKYDTMKVLNFHLKNYTLNIATLEGKKWKTLFPIFSTHFRPLVSSYTPWKHQETRGFLMFSEDIKRDQWHEMSSKVSWIFMICFLSLKSVNNTDITSTNRHVIISLIQWWKTILKTWNNGTFKGNLAHNPSTRWIYESISYH